MCTNNIEARADTAKEMCINNAEVPDCGTCDFFDRETCECAIKRSGDESE